MLDRSTPLRRKGVVLASLFLWAGIGAAPNAPPALPDPGFDLKTWRSEDGLPSDGVIALAQTGDGYLWIGTNSGLARFDGARFTVFDHRSTPELQSDQCGPLIVDPAGALWIGTMGGGLTRYANGRFTAFGKAEGGTFEYIMGMVADRRGRLWLGTNDRLHLWDGTRFTSFGPDTGVSAPRPLPLFEDTAGRVWVQSMDGTFGYFQNGAFQPSAGDGELAPRGFPRPFRVVRSSDGASWLLSSNPPALARWDGTALERFDINSRGSQDAVARVLTTRWGDVWVALRESGLRCVREGRMTTMGTADGLPSGPIAAIAADREGNVWVGTSGGLTRIKPRSFASFANAKGLENERTWTVFEDRRGDVWFGTDSIVWRWHDGRIDRYGPDEGLPAFGVTSFAEDADGALWIGSNGGLSRFDGAGMVTLRKSDGLPDDHVRALYEDREGRLWIGTLNGLAVKDHGRLKCYTTADGLPGNWVRSIHEDARGDIWLATTSGLSRLHDGAFTSFRTKDGLADDRVMAIHETADGALWFGTYRGGLSRLKDGRFATISHASGLHDDTVLTIQEDGRGTFWMSSPHGVFRVGRGELDAVADGRSRAVTSVAYDKSDGLPTTDCGGGTQPSGWRARDGRIWFPTSRGVAVLDPERVRVNTIAPAVHVEDVLYDRVHAGGPERVVLPAGTKSVELHYSASALGAPDRVRFRYRLEPFDSDWVDAGSRRVAYFTALRPGTYRFHVTAANESGVWNPTGAVYDLRVEPFFFETSAFAAVVITAIALLVWGAYRLRLRQVESRYAAVLSERGRIARELHDTIAQGFTGVSMQLEAASARLAGAPEAVRDNLDRARSLVRTSLNDARRSVRALRPHLLESGDLATSLRAVAEQLTSGTEVRSSVRVHGSKRRLPLPIEDTLFRMGQEAMTNAVRHGACRTLQITLDVKDGTITLTVEDDGSGFDPSRTENGSGITGMKERIERLGGTLLLKSEPGRGTHLVASVPATWGLSGGDA